MRVSPHPSPQRGGVLISALPYATWVLLWFTPCRASPTSVGFVRMAGLLTSGSHARKTALRRSRDRNGFTHTDGLGRVLKDMSFSNEYNTGLGTVAAAQPKT